MLDLHVIHVIQTAQHAKSGSWDFDVKTVIQRQDPYVIIVTKAGVTVEYK